MRKLSLLLGLPLIASLAWGMDLHSQTHIEINGSQDVSKTAFLQYRRTDQAQAFCVGNEAKPFLNPWEADRTVCFEIGDLRPLAKALNDLADQIKNDASAPLPPSPPRPARP